MLPARPGAPGPFDLTGGLTPGAMVDLNTKWTLQTKAIALRRIGFADIAICAVLVSDADDFIATHWAALAGFRCLVASP